ncbi:unnamed protein product [Effrenium voratum]|nr:unnamed protein product [Effrenium voratum]
MSSMQSRSVTLHVKLEHRHSCAALQAGAESDIGAGQKHFQCFALCRCGRVSPMRLSRMSDLQRRHERTPAQCKRTSGLSIDIPVLPSKQKSGLLRCLGGTPMQLKQTSDLQRWHEGTPALYKRTSGLRWSIDIPVLPSKQKSGLLRCLGGTPMQLKQTSDLQRWHEGTPTPIKRTSGLRCLGGTPMQLKQTSVLQRSAAKYMTMLCSVQVSRRHSHAAEADERPAEVARRHSYAVQADERAQQLKQTSVLQRCGLRRMRTRSERTRRCRLHGHHHPALAHQVSCSRRGMICPSSREMILAGLKLPAVNMEVEVLPCRKCPGWCEPSVESQEGPIEMPRREALAWNEASPSQTSLSSESLPKGDVAVRAREVRTRPCLARVPDYVNLVSITSKMRKQALNVHQQAAASSPRGSMKRAPFRAAMRLTRPPQRFRAGPET